MSYITVTRFIKTWEMVELNELAAAQSHFFDVCRLVKHGLPHETDPKGEFFRFEKPTEKIGGSRGRADVWYKDHFIWEYKGAHANLDQAYRQLLLYREALGNPYLLITSDLQRIVINTNFNNTARHSHEIDFQRLKDGDGLDLLKRAFFDPQSFRPKKTQAQITQESANAFIQVANTIQNWAKAEDRQENPEILSHFIIRLLFALFSEDMNLLPDNVFTQLVIHNIGDATAFSRALKKLFSTMQNGGMYGYHQIKHFDGGVFDDDYIPDLPGDILHNLKIACDQDWSSIDPSIFGTLFERIIDEDKRQLLGAHYTSKDDIGLIIEPVLMAPLRDEWQRIKTSISHDANVADKLLNSFSKKLESIRVLDPACGSGNFLYVALRQLLELQKEVIVYAARNGFSDVALSVNPNQLFGIETNHYAHELAQVTVWIGYLQWRFDNGFHEIDEPILQPLNNIQRRDAILSYDEDSKPFRSLWHDADVVIGNPPFLGSRLMRPVLGDEYCHNLSDVYNSRIKGLPDLVCYWFDQAQYYLERGKVKRVGLIATQAIRGGTNRQVLDRILDKGNIFLAWSDKDWILDGANVHVSIVGFDDGSEKNICLDGFKTNTIYSDLTSIVDLSEATSLEENKGYSFQGVVLRGPFNISKEQADKFLNSENHTDRSNSDVIVMRRTGRDIAQRSSNEYVIDFGVNTLKEDASKYKAPFEYLKENVYPMRQTAKQEEARLKWWLHWNPRVEMRERISNLSRYIATPRVSKHRIFVWLDSSILPDAQLVIFPFETDYYFGVLHSKVHELWARRMGTQLRDAESGFRYTSRTTFETFPFPWKISFEENNEIVENISNIAVQLNNIRDSWLYPPEEEIGVTISQSMLKKRTLTNLYNALDEFRASFRGKGRNPQGWAARYVDVDLELIETLNHLHDELDQTVIKAYGWSTNISDVEILERLLQLNEKRAEG